MHLLTWCRVSVWPVICCLSWTSGEFGSKSGRHPVSVVSGDRPYRHQQQSGEGHLGVLLLMFHVGVRLLHDWARRVCGDWCQIFYSHPLHKLDVASPISSCNHRCVAGCCLIPFFMDNVKDVHHQCPRCQAHIHTYRPFDIDASTFA